MMKKLIPSNRSDEGGWGLPISDLPLSAASRRRNATISIVSATSLNFAGYLFTGARLPTLDYCSVLWLSP